MQIKLSTFKSKKKNTIDIIGKEQTVRIITSEADMKDIPADDNIYVLAHSSIEEHTGLNKNGNLVVATTGEYEQKEVFISTQVNNVEEKKKGDDVSHIQTILDVVEVEIDGVRVLYYRDDMRIDKDTLNNIGIVDVMVLDVTADEKNLKTQISDINAVDPQIIIPFTVENVDNLQKLKSEMEINFDKESKFKAKLTDFALDDYVLHGVELD